MKLGYGISIANNNQRIFATAQAEQVIWKVAIFGAGTASSNGEYVWNGSELENGKPIYRNGVNAISYQNFSGTNYWGLFDDVSIGDWAYQSLNLTDWIIGDVSLGASPAPSSALSYSQSSFISSITLTGSNPSFDVDGVYTRTSGGATTFIGSGTKILYYDTPDWVTQNAFFGEYSDGGTGLFTWFLLEGEAPSPIVSALSYSA